jgi:hypothetical protein
VTRTRIVIAGGSVVLGLLSATPAATAYQRPGVRTQVDLTSTGKQPAVRAVVGTTAVSGDGRYVAFDSDAPDLLPDDNNQASDIFVRDTVTRKTELISRGTNGAPAAGVSACVGLCWGSPPRTLANGLTNPDYGAWDPSISRDGRYVAFTSTDVNLVSPARTVGTPNIYVYDRRTARMTLASVPTVGSQTDGGSFLPSISANGRYVSFSSDATNLVAGDTNGIPDVFVRDLVAGKTTRVSVGTGNVQSCQRISCASGALQTVTALLGHQFPESSISGDGRYVEFSDDACNLVPSSKDCEAGVPDVFVHDLKAGTTVRISVDPTGAEATYPPPDSTSLIGAPGYSGSTLVGPNDVEYSATGQTISSDGRYAAFASTAMNLVPNNPSWNPANPILSGVGIYVRDLRLGRTYRADVQSDGQPVRGNFSNGKSDADVFYPTISADGRFVAMHCTNCLVVSPVASLQVYDRVTGAAELIPCIVGTKRSGSPAGVWNCDWSPQISADGRHVSFTTYWTPTALLPNYVGSSDAFTWNRGPAVGTGGLAASGKLTVAGSSTFARTGVVSLTGLDGDVLDTTVAYRPREGDLFVRENLRSLPSVAGRPLPSAASYGFDLVASGRRYQVRAVPMPSTREDIAGGASFGLFRYDGNWRQVATLHGGFGTTGQEVVFAVPLADLGLRDGGVLSGLRAFTGLPVAIP